MQLIATSTEYLAGARGPPPLPPPIHQCRRFECASEYGLVFVRLLVSETFVESDKEHIQYRYGKLMYSTLGQPQLASEPKYQYHVRPR